MRLARAGAKVVGKGGKLELRAIESGETVIVTTRREGLTDGLKSRQAKKVILAGNGVIREKRLGQRFVNKLKHLHGRTILRDLGRLAKRQAQGAGAGVGGKGGKPVPTGAEGGDGRPIANACHSIHEDFAIFWLERT